MKRDSQPASQPETKPLELSPEGHQGRRGAAGNSPRLPANAHKATCLARDGDVATIERKRGNNFEVLTDDNSGKARSKQVLFN